MPDLETQLRNLADHRLAQVPAQPTGADDDAPVAEIPLVAPRRPRPLFLAAAALVLIVGVAVALVATQGDSDDSVVAGDQDEPADPIPAAMADRALVERSDWTAPLGQLATPATFVVAPVDGAQIQVAVPDRAQVRYRPASTYKLLNALLFQETGVAQNLDEVILWDGVDREIESWNRDHTLASAIEVSAVWVFEELSGRMDAARAAELVAAADYGNADIGDAIGAYWLQGALRISAIEQLAFLEDLYGGRLPLDVQNQADLVAAMTSTEVAGATIRYKTGTALAGPDPVAWLVGIVEPTDGAAQVFAFNTDLQVVDGEAQGLSGQERLDLVIELLTTAGIVG